jgi:hypothetical protein
MGSWMSDRSDRVNTFAVPFLLGTGFVLLLRVLRRVPDAKAVLR